MDAPLTKAGPTLGVAQFFAAKANDFPSQKLELPTFPRMEGPRNSRIHVLGINLANPLRKRSILHVPLDLVQSPAA